MSEHNETRAIRKENLLRGLSDEEITSLASGFVFLAGECFRGREDPFVIMKYCAPPFYIRQIFEAYEKSLKNVRDLGTTRETDQENN